MKKAAFTVLAVALLFVLCACAGVPSGTSSGSSNDDLEINTFYFVGGEFDREDLSLEALESYFSERAYNREELEHGAGTESLFFAKPFEDTAYGGFITVTIYDSVEEAQTHFLEEPSGAVMFRTTSHCRINNMVVFGTNVAVNALLSHFGLDEGFRNIMVEGDYSLEDVSAVLQELGFKIYGNSEIYYDAVLPSGRTALNIFVYENDREFQNACVNLPLMLSDEDYAMQLPLDPYATTLAFRQGRFILIGNIDWLYLVRTRLGQAAA